MQSLLLEYQIACEETADGTQWTICALELDEKPTETQREKLCHHSTDGCK